MPNPGLPVTFFGKSHRRTENPRFEQKIPGGHNIKWVLLISAIPGHL